MNDADCSKYRAIAARLNYVALDRPDMMYAAKECSRRMSKPMVGDWGPVRRLVRYMVEYPRMVHFYEFQSEQEVLTGYCDSNWAGCRSTRRSTGGMCLMRGGHLLKASSKTQSVVALSSAEAELYALVHASSELLGLKAMAEDFGLRMSPWLWVDASAAIGIAKRKGLGKVRHLDCQSLWVQDAIREKRMSLRKIDGKENPSDAMTKFIGAAEMTKHMGKLNIQVRDGRAAAAPEAVVGSIGVAAGMRVRIEQAWSRWIRDLEGEDGLQTSDSEDEVGQVDAVFLEDLKEFGFM